MEWQPIETAPARPLDKLGYGPIILLFVDRTVGVGFWDDDFGKFYVAYPERQRSPSPTHWMPLPADPH